MKKVIIIVGAVIAVAMLGLLAFLGYMGLFASVAVEEKELGPWTQVYESFTGPYAETGRIFDRVYTALKAKGIDTTIGLGVYLDDPKMTPRDKLHSDCGVVLQAQDSARAESLKADFQVRVLERRPSLVTVFPVKNSLSYMLAPMKAYPALTKYAREKGYALTGTYEMYDMPRGLITIVATYTKAAGE